MKTDIVSYALIAFGGFFGAVLRYLVDEQVPTLTGTLIVNFSGCFLMGIFMYESIYIGAFGRNTRIFFPPVSSGRIRHFQRFPSRVSRPGRSSAWQICSQTSCSGWPVFLQDAT